MQHEKEKRAIMDGLTAAAGAAFGHKFGYDRIGDNDFILVVDDEDPFEIVPGGEEDAKFLSSRLRKHDEAFAPREQCAQGRRSVENG